MLDPGDTLMTQDGPRTTGISVSGHHLVHTCPNGSDRIGPVLRPRSFSERSWVPEAMPGAGLGVSALGHGEVGGSLGRKEPNGCRVLLSLFGRRSGRLRPVEDGSFERCCGALTCSRAERRVETESSSSNQMDLPCHVVTS